ncbi:MjaI family restriction endonuclease [Anaerocellum danielii]|uniref:MjaI family restriction endonuclease n=1 Tax=Anaerocellum danielii TaxID=1387557 RepID=A0ABZ0U3F0_9FIRM|nr:MjaI family restriction endonuclease [Caldicellulosiruptor danielii]WPX08999.1 MjaI family restriction endonuclease [Caldicellulosiruptor danielii]
MAKEWILNMATNRWGLNKKDKVGPVAKWIRETAPKNLEEWEKAYLRLVEENILKPQNLEFSDAEEYLKELGRKLYIKITEVIQAEIDDVTEQDCINYIKQLVINRTFQGYITEKETIYGKIERLLNVKIHPAPDEWDRLYNVDFYIQINNKYIGIQIKPITYEHMPQIHNWIEWLSQTHKKFSEEFGGKVFVIFSITNEDGKKEIYNENEIIEQIKQEIERLKQT